MGFIQLRGADIHKKQKESAYFLPSIMIFAGSVTTLFLVQNDVFSVISSKCNGCIFSCICFFVLMLIAVSGLNLAGAVIVYCLDYLLGFFAALLAADRLASLETFSGIWFFWAISIFGLIFCSLFISSASCRFSRTIYSKFKSDSKFQPKLLRFVCICLGAALLIAFVFILALRLRPELFM